MDYILQIEKLYKYFELNLELKEMQKVLLLKKEFNNDLNLLGCFLKDMLTLENSGKISKDENIYNDFVMLFENYKEKQIEKSFIEKLMRYSNHYQTIIYEDTDNRVLLNTIASVNSCFMMEYYPFLMELIDEYLNTKIDSICFALMLQSITDTVFRNFENSNQQQINLLDLRKELNAIVNSRLPERLVI